jgi:hypothetical protein
MHRTFKVIVKFLTLLKLSNLFSLVPRCASDAIFEKGLLLGSANLVIFYYY